MDFDLEEGAGAGAGDGWRGRRRGNGGDGDGGLRTRRTRRRREQEEWMITLAIHAVYLAFNGLLYMVIQIKFQNLNSPFETHMAMKSSVVALCVYFWAAAVQTILVQTNNKLADASLLNHVIVCSGIISPLSDMLVFLPNMLGWIVVGLSVLATTILLAYDVYQLKSNSNVNAAPTPESVALEMSTGINHNAATTSESTTGISIGFNHNAATTSESMEMSTGINSNESSSSNDNDAVEI